MTHVRCFNIGYDIDNDKAYFNDLNAAERTALRVKFGGYVHPRFTLKSAFATFAVYPDHIALRNYINDSILGPESADNPTGITIPSEEVHNQEHIWVNGVWVCESKFELYEGEAAFTRTEIVTKESGTKHEFNATFYIRSFDYHMEP